MKPRKVLRIAYWEVTKSAGGIDRRTLAVVTVAIALLLVVGPVVALSGVGLEDDLYRVSVDETSPYYDVVEADDTFTTVDGTPDQLETGDIELYIDGFHVIPAETDKGLAAYDAFRDSVAAFNERQLRGEANQSAAFPVTVTLEFREQRGLAEVIGVSPEEFEEPDEESVEFEPPEDESPDVDDPPEDESPDVDDPPEDESPDVDDPPEDESPDVDDPPEDEQTGLLGDRGGPLADGSMSGSPADISPPFPFQSLVLAFLFIIPLNFVIQAYGSTILAERINRRGELLLVSPVSRFDIIAGKTLPYFLGALAVQAVLAVGLVYLLRGELGGLVSVLALTPLVLLFLGATFLGAMFARSFKELTFVTVTITVGLTTYAFVPAIFTDIDPIALISPLTLVVRDLQNEAIALSEFVFSVGPPTLVAVVFFALGAGLYREEDMFDQRSMSGKVLDSLVGPISKRWHVGVVTVMLIPFVFVTQLVAISLLFALGEIAIVLLLVVVAITEELAKSLHVYAAYEHRRFERTTETALVLGVIAGTAFFLGENIVLLGQLVGLGDLEIGEALLLFTGLISEPTDVLLLVPPFVLHVVTAAIGVFGASRGKRAYGIALSIAILVHLVYNLAVVSFVV